jgi:hypothetical protein
LLGVGTMVRRTNKKTTVDKPGIVLVFKPEEFACLKINTPGPSGLLGGYQRLENYLVINTIDLKCVLNAKMFDRIIRYINKHGPGGPNERIRKACTPVLRRNGIFLREDRS